MKVADFFSWLPFGGQRKKSRSSLETLRADFTARYHHFKLLLNANNETHELMLDMEEALRGLTPFGMHFVRAACTRMSTAVFQMVKHLNELAPGKYPRLQERFKDIQQDINPLVWPRQAQSPGPLVMDLAAVTRADQDLVGLKMANAGEMKNRLELNVPDGFVITAAAYRLFMDQGRLQEEIDRRIQAAEIFDPEEAAGQGTRELAGRAELLRLSASIQDLIRETPLPAGLESAIFAAYDGLARGRDLRLAMRSSCQGEDLESYSFAGQYRTALNIDRAGLAPAYKDVIASKYSPQATAYRLSRGVPDEDVAMCVGCMPMVEARSGGVAYSRSPVDIADTRVFIHSVWGLPRAVVEGSLEADAFIFSRERGLPLKHMSLARKTRRFVCDKDRGVCLAENTGEQAGLPSIDEKTARDLAELAVGLEAYYGSPQDMEWALDGQNNLVMLQCRPLKQVGEAQKHALLPRGPALGPVLVQGGETASPGAGAGPIYPILKDSDALSFPQGAVLLAEQALPRWAAMLNWASAVVTEQGSSAGHLANVAREFGVPALFGVGKAMDRLAPGQTVTVDATGKAVYDGRIRALLSTAPAARNLMKGSPVYAALQAAAEHILPLNLLDPEAVTFRPRHCRTFHDLTRFCHEKAVEEMFCFGTEHDFPEAAAKQLYSGGAKQFWVVNLDDGFKVPVREKLVRLEEIASIPMLALWLGMTAVPWAGPPPVDTKGFMSVLFEASVNPALVPDMKSRYAMKNYFMISKNFCSLQSRFGFHFCDTEALVGERTRENYISFQFKGGAANMDRRVTRARFVAEMLEAFDFRTQVREDSASARIEGLDQAFMEDRLKILGYLIMHTRQLDMVMADAASIGQHRNKLMKDIKEIVLKG
ncbi:MAG: PEP/pyruvate-binding domain-containing protein [Desulfovibrionaceae bacterium]|nr:PEP/pyruvate-binding domain-containing protein [Desulfovibrionaceae bacterium]